MSVNTDLVSATKSGDTEKVISLIESGGDIQTTVGDSDKRSLLHHAAQRGHADLVRTLNEMGLDVNELDKHGRTPLYLACHDHQFKSAKTLIELGAEINIEGDYNPLDIAASHSFYGIEIVQLLLQHTANVNIVCRGTRTTPLMGALHQKNPAALKLLLAAGANTNHTDANGESALTRIAVHDFGEHVALLIDHNANLNFKNRFGDTALHIAARRGNKNVAQKLLEKGIDLSLKNNVGQTAFDIAEKSNSEIAEMIRSQQESDKNASGSSLRSLFGKLWK